MSKCRTDVLQLPTTVPDVFFRYKALEVRSMNINETIKNNRPIEAQNKFYMITAQYRRT